MLAAVVLSTGLAMRGEFTSSGLAGCLTSGPDQCMRQLSQFNDKWVGVGTAGVLPLFLPLLIGLFWGAPSGLDTEHRRAHRARVKF